MANTDDYAAVSGPFSDPESEEFWTPERMARAVPVAELHGPDLDAKPPEPWPGPPATFGEGRRGAEPVEGGGTVLAPDTYQTLPVADPTAFPACTAGKLFMVFPTGEAYASAVVVGQNLVLTAAHAINAPGDHQWATDVAFVPAFTAPTMPFGYWRMKTGYVPQAWLDTSAPGTDYGACLVFPGGNQGRPVGAAVGTLQVLANQALAWWLSLGYPVQPLPGYPFDGNQMWESGGPQQPALYPNCITKEGNLTAGSSGGPWLVMSGGEYTVNGVYSTIFPVGGDFQLSSPYFDSGTIAFLNSVPPS